MAIEKFAVVSSFRQGDAINTKLWVACGLAVFAVLMAGGTGCTEEYLLRADHLAGARTLSAHGAPPDRIGILAAAPNGETRFLRYQRLKLPLLPPSPAASPVRAADSVGQRSAGKILFGLGLAHLAGLAAHIGYDVVATNRCRAEPDCLGEDFSLLFTGPVLGVSGFVLLIPGIALMATGYGSPSDVKPGRHDFTYIGTSSLTPAAP